MDEPLTVTIFHFDDEPELADWIPNALQEAYWTAFPTSVHGGDWVEPADGNGSWLAFTFGLTLPRRVEARIRYVLYSDPDEFERELHPAPHDIVLLDAMNPSPQGSMQIRGIQCYQRACDVVGVDRVFFITAYPNRVAQELCDSRPPVEQLIAKPGNESRITPLLMQRIDSVLPSRLTEDERGRQSS